RREIVIPDLYVDKSGWVVGVCSEFVEVLSIGSRIVLEVDHTMPDLGLCVGIGVVFKILSLCVVYVLLFFKIHIGIDTREDEILMIDNRKRDISYQDCSDKLAGSILFAIKINVF